MNREDKNAQTRRKIMDSALQEFSEKNYAEAAVNAICTTGGLSKGIIYHYFKDKDALYLVCVQECFDMLTAFLEAEAIEPNDPQRRINGYLTARFRFFAEHKDYGNLFFHAVLRPPAHLKGQIKQLRQAFDAQSVRFYKAALQNVPLREGVSEAEAVECFLLFQELFNTYFQGEAFANADFQSLVQAHEAQLGKFLNVLFYGIAKGPAAREESLCSF